MARAKSTAQPAVRRGHSTSATSEARYRHALPTPQGIPDADFERVLAAWSNDPAPQDIEVLVRLKCSGFTLRIGDRQTVIALLRAEQARRQHQTREASP
jgi:hypothetical protein